MPSPLQIPTVPAIPAIEDELDPLNPQIPAPSAVAPVTAPGQIAPTAQPLSALSTAPTTAPDPTVEQRVSSIISKGGPLQQLAKTQAAQQVHQKGLLNTSMAIGAAQKGVLSAALPIAQADAANALQLRLQSEKEGIDKRMLTASADEQIRLIAKKGELDTKLQEVSGSQAIEQIGARGEIESDLITRRGEIETQLQTADAENRSNLLKEQGNIDLELVKARGVEELSLRDRQAEIDAELTTLSAGFKTGDLAAQQEHERMLNAERSALEERMSELQADQRLVLQKLQGEQAVELEDVRGFYDAQISAQKSSAVLYNTSQQIIAEMLMNPDLTPKARTDAIQYQLDNLESSLSVLGAVGGVDIEAILGTFVPPTDISIGGDDTNAISGLDTKDMSIVGMPELAAVKGVPLLERGDILKYDIVYGASKVVTIKGDHDGPFLILGSKEFLEGLDPDPNAEHGAKDIFIPGIGWVPQKQFVNF